MTTGKTIALTRWTWTSVGKVMSLLFNMLSKLVIGFLPRSKHLLISPSAVILEPKKIKSLTVSTVVHKSHLSAGPCLHLARTLGAGACSACLPWVSQKTRGTKDWRGSNPSEGGHTHDELTTVWLHLLEKEGKCAICVNLLQKLETTRNLELVMIVKVSAAQLCLTLCDPMDCSPPGSSVHGILQTRMLEWVAISFS